MRVFFVAMLLILPAEAQRRAVSMTGWYKHANFYQSRDAQVTLPNPQTKQMEVIHRFTPEYEAALGNQAYQQLLQGSRVVSDPEVQGYLDSLVAKIVSSTPGPGSQYRLTVVDAPDVVNAVTPPGHVVVYTGLLSKVESEAELAAVLSHEIAHNYAHHVVRQVGKSAYIQAGINTMASAMQGKGAALQLITNIGSQMGANLFMKAFSRNEEKEADLYGAHLLFNAGYNPTALSSFFLKLYKDRPKQPFKLLSTHPSDPERATYISDYLEGFPLDRELQTDSDRFHAVKQKLGFQSASPTTSSIPSNPSAPGIVGGSGGAGNKAAPAVAVSQVPNPPQIPDPPRIPDPPSLPNRQPNPPPTRTGTATRSTPGPVPHPPHSEDPGRNTTMQLDKQTLEDFIRKTVPAGAQTTGATRDGGLQVTGGDSFVFEGDCPPNKCGEIVWDGEAKKGLIVTIDNNRPSTGTLEGRLPGTPVKVVNDLPGDLTILEQPSARNGWKRMTFRLNFDGGMTVSLRWKAQ